MVIGMMWYDPPAGRKRVAAPLSVRLVRAISHYRKTRKRAPDSCYVHPKTEVDQSVPGIEVKFSRYVMPNHLWIGVEDDKNTSPSP